MKKQELLQYESDLASAKKHFSYTKFILILAFCAWPMGLFFNMLIAFFIFLILFVLWSVSAYISFMHILSAQKKIDNLKNTLKS
jgi:hypothetical protein